MEVRLQPWEEWDGLPTADAATKALNAAKQALGAVIKGAVPQPTPVGANGTTAAGRPPDGSKAVTVVMFTEGRSVVTLKFHAAPGDAAPSPQTAQVGQRQDAQIRTTPY
jgi:hypothetical protein